MKNMTLQICLGAAVSAAAAAAPQVSHSAAGKAAFECGRYAEAEREFRAALEESTPSGNRAEEAAATGNLAAALRAQARLDQAEPLFARAMALTESLPVWEQSGLAPLLDSYAQLDVDRLRYDAAEQKFLRAARIARLGSPDHVSGILANYALLLIRAGRLPEAEEIEKRSIDAARTRFGEGSSKLAVPLLNLGEVLRRQGRLAEAEAAIREALSLAGAAGNALPRPWVAAALNNLAQLRVAQKRWKEAERLFEQALEAWDRSVGRDHPSYAKGLTNLGALAYYRKKYTRAEALYRQALEIDSARYGAEHPSVAVHLNNLGALLSNVRRYGEAEDALRRAVAIYERERLTADRGYLRAASNLAGLYHAQGRFAEAESQYRRVEEMARLAAPAEEPAVAKTLDAYATLLRQRSRPAEAEQVAVEAMRFRVRSALREDVGWRK